MTVECPECGQEMQVPEEARKLVPLIISSLEDKEDGCYDIVLKYATKIADPKLVPSLLRIMDEAPSLNYGDGKEAFEGFEATVEKFGLTQHQGRLKQIKDEKAELERKAAEKRLAETRRRIEEVQNLRDNLRVGMTLAQVESILGPHSSSIGGGDVLGRFGNVVASQGTINSMSQRQYYVWRRPEGEWKLVFSGGTVVDIYSTP